MEKKRKMPNRKHPIGAKTGKHMLGRKLSEETKRKIGLAFKGNQYAKGNIAWNKGKECPQFQGENNGMWTGGNIGRVQRGVDVYRALHSWVQENLGTPDTCEHCNKSGLKGHKIHWANKSREYKLDLNDWLRLCVPCHKSYDINQ